LYEALNDEEFSILKDKIKHKKLILLDYTDEKKKIHHKYIKQREIFEKENKEVVDAINYLIDSVEGKWKDDQIGMYKGLTKLRDSEIDKIEDIADRFYREKRIRDKLEDRVLGYWVTDIEDFEKEEKRRQKEACVVITNAADIKKDIYKENKIELAQDTKAFGNRKKEDDCKSKKSLSFVRKRYQYLRSKKIIRFVDKHALYKRNIKKSDLELLKIEFLNMAVYNACYKSIFFYRDSKDVIHYIRISLLISYALNSILTRFTSLWFRRLVFNVTCHNMPFCIF